jgi:hypothetical protein
LREAYRGIGLEVRFYPDCCTIMRWQLGRNGDGQHFALIAFGSTPECLLECVKTRARSQARNGGRRVTKDISENEKQEN